MPVDETTAPAADVTPAGRPQRGKVTWGWKRIVGVVDLDRDRRRNLRLRRSQVRQLRPDRRRPDRAHVARDRWARPRHDLQPHHLLVGEPGGAPRARHRQGRRGHAGDDRGGEHAARGRRGRDRADLRDARLLGVQRDQRRALRRGERIWNIFTKLGLPLLALGILAVTGHATPTYVTAAVIGVAVLAVAVTLLALVFRSEHFARVIGDGLARIASVPRRWFGKPADRGMGRRRREVPHRHDGPGPSSVVPAVLDDRAQPGRPVLRAPAVAARRRDLRAGHLDRGGVRGLHVHAAPDGDPITPGGVGSSTLV